MQLVLVCALPFRCTCLIDVMLPGSPDEGFFDESERNKNVLPLPLEVFPRRGFFEG